MATNGHVPGGEMNPYSQQPYSSTGYSSQQSTQSQQPQQQPQSRPYQSTYLPPMQSNVGAPGLNPHGMASMAPMPLTNTLASSASVGAYSVAPHPASMTAPGPSNAAPPRQMQLAYTSRDDKYEYSLAVEQQPQRARMCGFGDKDRRPITPPPCVRLVIKDIKTGKEVDIENVNGSFFVLQVDLWDENAEREVNIVRASSSSPAVSISTATTTSFPPTPERSVLDHTHMSMYMNADNTPMYAPGYMRSSIPTPYGANYMSTGYPQPMYMPQSQSASMMFTRNLIGSLTVNASKLSDLNNQSGYWFVLQDLSVRTEGFFRLKMNFIDVAAQMGGSGLNRGKAPVLAWVFSDKFQVYSAKKFPGVIESTPLSKRFASQGIKIPIRKDVKNEHANEEEEEG